MVKPCSEKRPLADSAIHGDEEQKQKKKTRSRTSFVCIPCRQRRIRCDRAKPTCDNCARLKKRMLNSVRTSKNNPYCLLTEFK